MLAKIVPTFEDICCHVVSTMNPPAVNLGFLDRSRYFFIQVAAHLIKMAEEGVEVLSTPQAVKSKDPNQPLTYRYWTRPTHLQYKYLYNYRYNYYDDVIDYLDKRSKGLTREIPRAQTWAERALRSFSSRSETYSDRHKDWELLNTIRASNNYYHYHSRDYITKRYPALLY
uniref:Uncharacterized protein n=2 Tax=Timema TaxID=61471 RepID=A0A7R9ITH0_9NEOP|nr:unnamed protein product [Timema tahoe]